MNVQIKRIGVLMITLVLVFSLANLSVLAENTDDIPPIPDSFHGELTINGFNASEGTELQARINGIARGNITTEQPGYYGNPDELNHLDVTGTNDEIGEPIDFYRKEDDNWILVSETDPENVEFEGGQTEQVNLNFATGMPVTVSPPEDQVETEIGTYTYDYEVTNDGEYNDTYDLTASSSDYEGFSVEVDEEVNVNAGSTEFVEVEVTIQDEAEYGDNSEIDLSAESQNDPYPSDIDSMMVTLEEPPYYFDVTIDEDSSDTEVVEGEELDIIASINNLGDEQATQEIELYEGDNLLDSEEVTLDGENEETVTLTWLTGADDVGDHTLTVESEDESDDIEITVLEEAYFAVTIDEDSSDAEVVEGEELDVIASINNLGDEQATQEIELYEGGNLLDSEEVTLGGGSDETVTLTWLTGADDVGDHTLTVESEDDADNIEVTVLEEAYFAVTIDEDSSDTEVVEGEELDIIASINNLGDEQVTQEIELYEGDNLLDSEEVTLYGENEETVTLTWVTGADDVGDHTLTVESEDDADNIEVTVLEEAYFAVTIDEDSSDTEVVEGEELDVIASINNLGDEQATQEIELYEGGNLLDSEEVTLDGENEETVTLTWLTGADDVGDHKLTVESEDESDDIEVIVSEADVIYELEIDVEGSGIIEVDGEEVETPYVGDFVDDTEVELEAHPGEGWKFYTWLGDHESEENQITITIEDNMELTASFELEYEPEIADLQPGEGDTISGESVTISAILDHPENLEIDSATVTLVETGLALEANTQENQAILDMPFVLDTGEYTYNMYMVDENEDDYSTEVSFSVDNTPPEIEIISPTNGNQELTYEEEFTIEGSTESGTLILIEGEEVDSDESGTFLYETILTEGQNVFHIVLEDEAGNTAFTEVYSLYLPDIQELWTELDDIWYEIDDLYTEIDHLTNEIDDLHDQLDSEISNLQDQIDDLHDQLDSEISNLQDQIDDLHDQLDSEISNLQDQIDDLHDQLTTAIEYIENLQEDINEVQNRIVGIEGDLSEARDDINSLQNDLNEAEQEITNLQNDISEAEEEITKLQDDLSEAEQDIIDLEEEQKNQAEDISLARNIGIVGIIIAILSLMIAIFVIRRKNLEKSEEDEEVFKEDQEDFSEEDLLDTESSFDDDIELEEIEE